MKRAGSERVSRDALLAFRDAVEEEALELAKSARDHAQHADRQTVQREDVSAAGRKMKH